MSESTSTLRREDTALIVIDIQERLAAAMARRDAVAAHTALLVRVAAIVGVPIIATRQYPKGLGHHSAEIGSLLEEVAAAGASVSRVDKVTFDCFGESAFVAALEATGRRQLLLAGMETHICVCQTALAGTREGYDVHVAADACCSRGDACHTYAVSRLGHAGVAISTSESAAYELVGQAGTPEFKALLRVVKGEA